MIVKTKTGRAFGGCVRYNLERDKAEILHAEGVRIDTPQHMIDDFNHVRKQNPDLGQAVWHTSISFPPDDKTKVTEQLMKDITKDYVDKFKLEQYVVIRHNDQGQEHFHIIGNRVNYDGSTVSDKFCAGRGVELSHRLEKKYELTQARTVGKRLDLTHEDKLQGATKIKYDIYKAVQQELPKCKSLEDLQTKLKIHGIDTDIKAHSSGQVYGVSFKKDGIPFKGSAIDKGLGAQQLNKTIENVLKHAIQNVVPGLSQVSKVVKIGKALGRGHGHEQSM